MIAFTFCHSATSNQNAYSENKTLVYRPPPEPLQFKGFGRLMLLTLKKKYQLSYSR